MAAALRIRLATSNNSSRNEFQGGRGWGIPGEDAAGVMSARELDHRLKNNPGLRLEGETLVVGGDDAAFEAAVLAARLGSEKVTVVCPERRNEIRASDERISEARANGVKIVCGWGPLRIGVHTDRRVSGVFFKHCARAFDDEGRFLPTYDEEDVMAQYCDNLIMALDEEGVS